VRVGRNKKNQRLLPHSLQNLLPRGFNDLQLVHLGSIIYFYTTYLKDSTPYKRAILQTE
jgi:hypothetical protein